MTQSTTKFYRVGEPVLSAGKVFFPLVLETVHVNDDFMFGYVYKNTEVIDYYGTKSEALCEAAKKNKE